MDIDGTLTQPGAVLCPFALQVLNAIKAQVVLITAQAESYADKIGCNNFPNLVSEKGMTIRIDGGPVFRGSSPSVVADFIGEMKTHLASLTHSFVLNAKMAGYAVGFRQDVPANELASVKGLMVKQILKNSAFQLEETAGFIDLTLVRLSKATALAKVRNYFPATSKWVACGDSVTTDGPMLDAADKGIMVTNAYRDYPVLPRVEDMLTLLNWFGMVKAASNDLSGALKWD
ncbi:hypothetical protein ACRYWZ_17780 (plasmid) [Agrobacterium deltaense]|uniref:hypothetical protein n=1 Tax=Agrobacterium deltaense TaxID=1183412 RepID=UPI003D954A8C